MVQRVSSRTPACVCVPPDECDESDESDEFVLFLSSLSSLFLPPYVRVRVRARPNGSSAAM